LGAVGAFTSRAAEKLRRQNSAVNTLTVFISKNRYGTEPPPYTFSTVITLPVATDDTGELLRHVRVALKRIWKPHTVYKKAGVVLDGLETAGQQQLNLFASPNRGEVRAHLMQELDQLNQRFGAGTVSFATALSPYGKHHAPWLGKADRRSARFTTCWDELWCIGDHLT
jgi:DNA polymerase V